MRINDTPDADGWIEEFYYFGNANWPSDATYRRKGDVLQCRVEMQIHLEAKDDDGSKTYLGSAEKVADFLQKYVDVKFHVGDGYEVNPAYGGGHVPPNLFIIGWVDWSTPEQLKRYEEDKRIG